MSERTLAEEAEAALSENAGTPLLPPTPPEQSIPLTNENALIVIAQSLVAIEKHLFALVYIENTKDPDKTGLTYVPDVFKAIYDGGDPFADVKAEVDARNDEGKDG